MLRLLLASLLTALSLAADAAPANDDVSLLLQPTRSPLVSFRILVAAGSADDPQGKEGVAALTAALLAEGGSHGMTYDQILEAMYPMATTFSAQVDKEMTVFRGTTHIDNLARYYEVIREMLLEPGFREEDFTRLKTEAMNYLKVSLREGNDEELGKEQLYNLIYSHHPYGHHNLGRVSSLEQLTLEDIRAFYKSRFKRGNFVVGLAGGYPKTIVDQVRADFAKLPPGRSEPLTLPPPPTASGSQFEIIQRETRSTAWSIGFPIDVVRGDRDWPALALVASYFGQHRSSNSLLYQRLREARGLNYGDYAYIEYFPRGMFQFQPDPNLARRQQIFQIWIRPVEPQNGLFALRAALYEYDKLLREGLSQQSFEATREFLSKYVYVLLQTQEARLGYSLDSQFYGIPDFDRYLRDALAKLTVQEVNEVIRRRLKPGDMRIVAVTKDAAALRESLLRNLPSPIAYNSPKPKAVLDEDKTIESFSVLVKPEAVTIRPVAEVFQ